MPSKIIYTSSSVITEECVWIGENTRDICFNYTYIPDSGYLTYAASVYKKTKGESISEEMVKNHEHTTCKRFDIRPVEMYSQTYMTYENIIRTIRHEMCHGYGCKGPKINDNYINYVDTESDTSEFSYASDASTLFEYVEEEPYKVSDKTMNIKTVRKLRYHLFTDELYNGFNKTQRDIFICFKGSASNGELLFGACISRNEDGYIMSEKDIKEHWKTAKARLDKCPVHMNISDEYRYQLKKVAKHREDVMYEIIDTIFTRKHGLLQIKGGK